MKFNALLRYKPVKYIYQSNNVKQILMLSDWAVLGVTSFATYNGSNFG
jgi:hypothetical protein